ncbi:hypothetical protein MNEG_7450 [Monoraphidium neglectum]|uniref:ubiquitinyl hydrolase 1 n=1 Tax=Monoraphidium neglectum TaxID=145388 RepID=A0A0D2N2X2_9CHLO|nr:hypothetical protein MNEG_7450 [Monoraphidium neglectum]KIZ00511.1 hypothetical protein MNEG_7450 [Monoraphidium neglectum]|eukprot:XP_013899530.1 hypothetical protein MNEG_7450 [Monoraphidium neglectum]
MEADYGADDRDQAGRIESDLVGPRQPLQSLVDRYRAGSPALAGRLAALAPSFPACRPVTGDGNCFYRGFLFALLEALLEAPLLELHARLVSRVRSLRRALVSHPLSAARDAGRGADQGAELLLSLLSRVWYAPGASGAHQAPQQGRHDHQPAQPPQQASPLFKPELEAALSRRAAFDPIVQFARLAASLELRRNEAAYTPFVAGCGDAYAGLGLAEICERHVERMGQEVEQLQMAALAAALGVTVGVIDVAGSETGVVRHPAGEVEPLFFLVHLPGHYEICYRNPSL